MAAMTSFEVAGKLSVRRKQPLCQERKNKTKITASAGRNL